ncbi:olfactory receptor 52D1-like [Hyperolius riggenbachi]|uniref:olfactory receptor 52D1-like n=1 Tax=Hyperolius riggenbachi TaxID=752182 RepID=UPI0035A2CC19
MEKDSTNYSFVLLGLAEMERLRYLYCPLLAALYFSILTLSLIIVLVVMTDRSLHEPMYILIGNLALSGIIGSSVFFPKFTTDLWITAKTVSRNDCLIQAFCLLLHAHLDIQTFTMMAYDRYLAVCHPLHYISLMTITKVLQLIIASFLSSLLLSLSAILLVVRVPLCGTEIKNIFCDNMAIYILACTDTPINNIMGSVITVFELSCSMLIIVFSYVRIYVVCFKLSKQSRHKALHTLVTHLINFSIFLLRYFFMILRYRLGYNNLPVSAHVGLSMPGLLIPPLVNPVVFGVRTKALKTRIVYHLNRRIWFRVSMANTS